MLEQDVVLRDEVFLVSFEELDMHFCYCGVRQGRGGPGILECFPDVGTTFLKQEGAFPKHRCFRWAFEQLELVRERLACCRGKPGMVLWF